MEKIWKFAEEIKIIRQIKQLYVFTLTKYSERNTQPRLE